MHPYNELPARQYWSRAVTEAFDPIDVGTFPTPLIRSGDRIVSAGSCFAARVVPYLEKSGLRYFRTEYQHPLFAKSPPEAMSYAAFSAGYGNVYTTRQLYQLLLRAMGRFRPQEDCWLLGDALVDPFRPGLRYAARSTREFAVLTAQHLSATRQAFESCDVFILTLGLSEAWISTDDGAVFPACPGTVAGAFDPRRHRFVNFSAADVALDLCAFIKELRAINPRVRIILSVSPVPMVATATGQHVLAATTYSKAALRVAADTATREYQEVYYFPSYEIVTGPQAPADFFEPDRRSVSKRGLDVVMAAFLAHCERVGEDIATAPTGRGSSRSSPAQAWSKGIVDGECEEATQDL
jgi:hypothetical protein